MSGEWQFTDADFGGSDFPTEPEPMTTINRDEWLEALGEASRPEPDPMALSIDELAKLLKLQRKAAEFRALKLVEEGKATEVTKIITLRDGSNRRVRAFKLLNKKKAK